MTEVAARLKAMNGFLAKSDGRDKLTATIQYACMFASAGEPGNLKKIQGSVAAARKVFRVMRPLESLVPLLTNPTLDPKKPVGIEILNKLKSVLMAIYFGGDHVVWASQAGLTTNKEMVDRWQKISLYGWFGGSLCTLVSECYEVLQLTAKPKEGESEEAWRARQEKVRGDVNARLLVLFHALVQAALAVGLLQLRPWKPRTVGFIGVVASALNCYMLCPPVAASAPAPKALPAKVVSATVAPSAPKLELKKA